MFTRTRIWTAILMTAWLLTASAPARAQNWGGAGFRMGEQRAQLGISPRNVSAAGAGSRSSGVRAGTFPTAPQVSRQPLHQIPAVKKTGSGQASSTHHHGGTGQPGPLAIRNGHRFPQAAAVAVAVASAGGSCEPGYQPPVCNSPPACAPPPCHVVHVRPATYGPEHYFELASSAFEKRDYHTALSAVERAIEQLPSEPDLHQFRSLVLFAQGEYIASAAAAYTALSAGPGWNWNTLYEFYGDAQLYTRHLRALEAATKDHADSAEHHFLLGYHYLMLNQVEAGRHRLQRVLEIRPDDPLSENLLAILPPTP